MKDTSRTLAVMLLMLGVITVPLSSYANELKNNGKCYDYAPPYTSPGVSCGLCAGNDCHSTRTYNGRYCGYSSNKSCGCKDGGTTNYYVQAADGTCQKDSGGTCHCYVGAWYNTTTTSPAPSCSP